MKKHYITLNTSTLLLVLLVSALSNANNFTDDEIAAESKKVNQFLDEKFDEYLARNPEYASYLGSRINYDSWSDRSDRRRERELAISKAKLETLATDFNLDTLDEQTKLTVRMVEEDIKRQEESLKWYHYDYLVNQLEGIHQDVPTFLANIHRIDNLTDAEAYISRLEKLDRVFDQTLENLKISEELGSIPPHFTFRYVINDLKDFIEGFDRRNGSNVLLSDLDRKLDKLKNVDEAQKEALKDRAFGVISTKVKSAYRKLLDYWTTLEPKAKLNGDNGAWSLPNGTEYYAYKLRYHTTTGLTPEEIFETGLAEVKRIHGEMRTIMKKVNFTSDSLTEFFDFVRTDRRFKYPENATGVAQVIEDANGFIDKMRVKLPEMFLTLPKAPLEVKSVEPYREKSAGGAFYESPAEDGSRPGRYYLNTYNMSNIPKYSVEALSYHEGIPGHHMQLSIAQELKGVPKFRKYRHFTAYIEGWALYTEKLGKEIGEYQDHYSDFGRLGMEIFRAARLVVDTGIHSKRWTRRQAIDYFLNNTANSEGDIKNEIERYFLWPGQATGYKIGMIKILELRDRAKVELGEKFDIREFHNVVLTNGAVMLTTLEKLVDNWIKEKLK